jgi:endoglucanase
MLLELTQTDFKQKYPVGSRKSSKALPAILRRSRSACYALLCWLAALSCAAAQADPAGPPLRRGVNLSNWFIDDQRELLGPRDFQQIKNAGIDHVRIPVNPELLGFSLFEAQEGRVLFDYAKLDSAIDMARDVGLSAILDIQVSDSFLSQVEQDPGAEAGFVSLWGRLADHYKSYPASAVAFEILNEPRYVTEPARYRTLISDVIAAIRPILPAATIIVDLPRGASLDAFDGFAPIEDANLIYAFHFYEPYLFTHQGLKAPGSFGYSLRSFHNLPYPSTLVDPKVNYASSAPDPLDAKKNLSDYVAANWGAARIARRIKLAADWAKANQRRVLCAEFGVVRKYAAPADRYKWIEDARRALEGADIGWDLWDYTDQFGITLSNGDAAAEPDEGSREIEPEARDALFKP